MIRAVGWLLLVTAVAWVLGQGGYVWLTLAILAGCGIGIWLARKLPPPHKPWWR